jgi:putative oxygen-independent coproporphyrinogen III oxidase
MSTHANVLQAQRPDAVTGGHEVPLSLYIHFPWCVRKCPYCDFNSHALRDPLPEEAYLAALFTDLDAELATAKGRSITSIFIGGGTPSLISPRTIGAVIERVAAHGCLDGAAEITLEANPGASDRGRFEGFRAAGVNRLSIGAQSFSDRMLKAIGRIHDAQQGLLAVQAARDAGFDNINIDLMFGLPGQTTAEADADIDTVIRLAPPHLSYYQLTLEPNTLFHERPPRLPDTDLIDAGHDHALERLRQGGWIRYEVSALARDGYQCRHNRNYWEFGDYLAIGAGAHGKITDVCGTIRRYAKTRHPKRYMEAGGQNRIGDRLVPDCDRLFEFMLNALRLADGFSVSLFTARTGIDAGVLEQRLAAAMGERLLERIGDSIRPTERGYRYLNTLLETLLPDDDAGQPHQMRTQ